MKTFEQAYCQRHRCTPTQFRRRVFWRTLHWHALPFAPLFALGAHFSADYDLIAACGRATSAREIAQEIVEHHYHPFAGGWLRRQLRLRVSRARLLRLAQGYVSSGKLSSPITDATAR